MAIDEGRAALSASPSSRNNTSSTVTLCARGSASVPAAMSSPPAMTSRWRGTRSASRPNSGWNMLEMMARDPTTRPTSVALASSDSVMKMAMKVNTHPMPRPNV